MDRVTRITIEEVELVMRVQDVREKLGIGQAKPYRLIYRGDFPAYRWSGCSVSARPRSDRFPPLKDGAG